MEDKKLTYKDAGVDTKEGERAVSLMKEHVKGTFNENVLTGLGSFGSLFNLDDSAGAGVRNGRRGNEAQDRVPDGQA